MKAIATAQLRADDVMVGAFINPESVASVWC